MQDYAHMGFASFRTLIRLSRPRLMLHGHSHAVKNLDQTESTLYDTPILNVYPHRLLELSADEPPAY
jgi:hypothetical protein